MLVNLICLNKQVVTPITQSISLRGFPFRICHLKVGHQFNFVYFISVFQSCQTVLTQKSIYTPPTQQILPY